MYVLKLLDEYGKTSYFSETLDNAPQRFDTVEEAEEKANELLNLEFDDFASAITKYYIVKLEEVEEKSIESFRMNDDGKECVLSCTDTAMDKLTGSLNEIKKLYDVNVISDRTYENGSRVVKFKYTKKKEKVEEPKKKEEEYDILIVNKGNVFSIGYKTKNNFEVTMLARVLRDKYKDDIIYYSSERENEVGLTYFKLVDKQKEFKDDLIKGAELFFKVKYVEK